MRQNAPNRFVFEKFSGNRTLKKNFLEIERRRSWTLTGRLCYAVKHPDQFDPETPSKNP